MMCYGMQCNAMLCYAILCNTSWRCTRSSNSSSQNWRWAQEKEDPNEHQNASLRILQSENHVFLYVFLMTHFQTIENTTCLQRFRQARAAAARLSTWWYFFLQWIINIDTWGTAKSLVHVGVCGVKPRFP